MRTSDIVDEILGTRWYSGGGGDSAISFQNVLTHILNLHWLFLAICNSKSASKRGIVLTFSLLPGNFSIDHS